MLNFTTSSLDLCTKTKIHTLAISHVPSQFLSLVCESNNKNDLIIWYKMNNSDLIKISPSDNYSIYYSTDYLRSSINLKNSENGTFVCRLKSNNESIGQFVVGENKFIISNSSPYLVTIICLVLALNILMAGTATVATIVLRCRENYKHHRVKYIEVAPPPSALIPYNYSNLLQPGCLNQFGRQPDWRKQFENQLPDPPHANVLRQPNSTSMSTRVDPYLVSDLQQPNRLSTFMPEVTESCSDLTYAMYENDWRAIK
jgi:hypothetical protein